MGAKDPEIAKAIVSAVKACDSHLILVALSGSEMIKAAKADGLTVASEVFADRAYNDDGSLVSRSLPGAVITDAKQVAERAVIMFIKDSDLVYREATLSVAAAAGLSSALDVIGKSDYDIFPAYLADGYVENDRKVLKSGTPIIGKIVRTAEGGNSEKWAQTWKYPITNEAGRVIGIYGYSIDVSSLVSLAEGVPDSNGYFELVNNIPVGIGMTADAFDSDIRKGLESGLNDYVTKPIDKRKLLQTLTEAITDK